MTKTETPIDRIMGDTPSQWWKILLLAGAGGFSGLVGTIGVENVGPPQLVGGVLFVVTLAMVYIFVYDHARRHVP